MATALATIVIAITVNTTPAQEWEHAGTYEVTAYSYSEGCGENYHTSSGAVPQPYYTVACHDYPSGTILFIEDIGTVEVQDTGSFEGKVIDLHIGDDDPNKWGRKEKTVWIKIN